MRHFLKSFTRRDWTFFILSAIGYFFLIRQYIPINWDDLSYAFVYGIDETKYISSWKDILESQIWHYQHLNGRFLVHCMVQYFCGFGGDTSFFILSSIMFMLLLMSMTYLVRIDATSRLLFDKELILVLLILICPLFGTTFLGTKAFVVNYMFSASFYIFFLAIYTHIKDDKIDYSWWLNCLIFLWAFLTGSLQESFSIGIAGALLFYHLYTIRNTRGTLLILLIGFGIGTLFSIFAPANLARSAATGLSIVSGWKYVIVASIKHIPTVTICFLLAIASLFLRHHNRTDFIKSNYLYFMPSAIAFAFAMIISFYGGEYQFTIIGVMTVIILLRFISEINRMSALSQYILTMSFVILLIAYYIPIYIFRNNLNSTFTEFTQYIEEHPSREVVDSDFEEVARNSFTNNFLRERAVSFELQGIFSNTLVSEKLGKYLLRKDNDDFCRTILPESAETIIRKCCEENKITTDIFYSKFNDYYIIRQAKDEVRDGSILISAEGSSIITRFKDKLMHRKVRDYILPLATSPNFVRRYTEDEEYRYYIVCFKEQSRAVINIKLCYDE